MFKQIYTPYLRVGAIVAKIVRFDARRMTKDDWVVVNVPYCFHSLTVF